MTQLKLYFFCYLRFVKNVNIVNATITAKYRFYVFQYFLFSKKKSFDFYYIDIVKNNRLPSIE